MTHNREEDYILPRLTTDKERMSEQRDNKV